MMTGKNSRKAQRGKEKDMTYMRAEWLMERQERKRVEKWGIWYSVPTADGNWADKYIRVTSKERLEHNLGRIKELGYRLDKYRKLYPFNMEKNQHHFELIHNIVMNELYDIWHGEKKVSNEEYERLEETKEKAERFFCAELPIAWVPWEDYKEMKEFSVAAEIHRDEANARARSEER